ncbi:nuclear transport factor 2 family protein [Dactylosporangium sp. CA-233914]|uniref:nuclear transport factor 2 family protein n=1 Tax=Dactylosporangium sp. CA-233914 TaxID=3239934 RepID=UPI003D910857
MSDLDQRVAVLEAESAIKALKARYARLCDADYPPAELAALFTEDGVWEADRGVGRHVGRAAIEEFFTGMCEQYVWAQHYMLTPSIQVAPDAKSARGSWYLLMPCIEVVDGKKVARWMMGLYDDEYVWTDKGWMFSNTRLRFEVHADHATGWVPARFAG